MNEGILLRIDLTNLTPKEIEMLERKMEEIEEANFDWWYVFGKKIIEISGEAPYNSQEELEKQIRSVPFGDKLKIEIDEK
jgi:hypothetical protein